MTARPNVYHALFNTLFGTSEAPSDTIRRLLPPKVADAIDPASIAPVLTATLSDPRADLAFKARIDGSDGFICLLFGLSFPPTPDDPARQGDAEITPLTHPVLTFAGSIPYAGPLRPRPPARTPPAHRRPMMTTAERLREEGREQARKQGREEGWALMFIDLMQVRFGPLPPEIESRVRATHDTETLRRWLPRVLAASRPDDVFTDPPR